MHFFHLHCMALLLPYTLHDGISAIYIAWCYCYLLRCMILLLPSTLHGVSITVYDTWHYCYLLRCMVLLLPSTMHDNVTFYDAWYYCHLYYIIVTFYDILRCMVLFSPSTLYGVIVTFYEAWYYCYILHCKVLVFTFYDAWYYCYLLRYMANYINYTHFSLIWWVISPWNGIRARFERKNMYFTPGFGPRMGWCAYITALKYLKCT